MLGERRRARACAALLTATSLILSACTTVVQGLPVNASGRPLTVDTALLDVGNYPTKLRPPLGTAGTPLAGAINDGQRMGNHVVGPWEVDPTLKSTYAMGARVLTSPDELTIIGPAELVAAAGRHNFINGFVSARQAEGRTTLMNTVLRFADPPSAAAAAADMGQTVLNQQSSSAPVRPVSIPGHPDALATSYSFIDDATKRRWIAVRSFTSHGPYVLTQLAESVDGQDAAVTLIANTINLQRPVIDRFEATDTA
ncbi:MAG: hypothetical protein Q7U75_06410, partial [Desulfobacterales bacterium]|nr:hypothetical protein [Desulfobacterales bacterium]